MTARQAGPAPSTSASSTVDPSSTSPARLPMPSRNPLPLSSAQEQQVRDLYYKRVRGYCAAEIKDFATCALNRTISATWACRTQRLAMNSCMVGHATMEEQDRAREEWFATRLERQREREEKEQKRIEEEKFFKEWWGMDEKGRDKAGRRPAGEDKG